MKFQKAPLSKEEKKQGWCLFQKKGDEIVHAWSQGQEAEGATAKALLEQKRKEGASLQEIPLSYRALPTGIDLQVHLRYPGQSQKEVLEGGLESALLGGFDSIVTMPNTNPFLDNPEALAKAIAESRTLASHYPVRIGFTAAGTIGMQGEAKTDILALAKAGAVAITDDGWGVKSDEAMNDIFAACAEADLLFQQHAETPGHKGFASESHFQKTNNVPPYPRTAESSMIRRDLALLRKNPKARYHVLHVTTRESLIEIEKGKAEGLRITAEVSPHHLFFANSDIPEGALSTNYKMNPPLFAPEDRAALRAALRSGVIDCVSTDHAPHEAELKAKGWLLAPFGTRGMETALPTLLTLVKLGELSWERMLEVFHTSPRKILARTEFAKATGLLFVDPAKKYRVGLEELPGVSQNSCFLGSELTGRLEIRAEAHAIYRRV